jgi:hypothetical protein
MHLQWMHVAKKAIQVDPACRVARPGAYPPDNSKRIRARAAGVRAQDDLMHKGNASLSHRRQDAVLRGPTLPFAPM